VTARVVAAEFTVVGLWLSLAVAAAAAGPEPERIEREIEALIVGAASTPEAGPTLAAQQEGLRRVYGADAYRPIWFRADATTPAVAVAIAALRAAPDHGIPAEAYAVAALERAVAAARATGRTPAVVARADVALTAAMLQFLSDLHKGRVRPQDVEPHYRPPAKSMGELFDGLRGAVAQDRLGLLIAAAEPSFPLYRRIKPLLARYRALAAQPLPPLPSLPPKTPKIEPGGTYADVAAVHARLARLGDLPEGSPRPSGDRYAGELVEGVMRFQRRHGLDPDGVLGRQTLAALNVPPEVRARQLELALERLRWLPEPPQGPVIVINIPSFRLWVFEDAAADEKPALAMRVIVGRAIRTETPVFIGEMRYVEFSPYWNVPPNILRNELLPTLRRDPAYLERNDLEMISTRGDGTVTTVVDATTLAALRDGSLRLRQRPGERNALGGVKFVLPNTMDIYLHATPARQLFERTRRDFSHGCIRVADPMGLTRFVLRDQPEWTDDRIEAAMAAGRTTTVKLAMTLPVIVFYTTAIVDRDGRALFLDDIYGHDRALDRALRAAGAGPR
jgi:murein L,D-transpeptidase YcbB/YkuD